MSFARAMGALHRLFNANPSALLAAMLMLLYLVLEQPPGTYLAKALFVAHMGLFIVWQPLVEGQQRMSVSATLLLVLLMAAMTLSFDGWTVVAWTMMLAAVVGGRVLLAGSPRLRMAYLGGLGFLVLALLLLAIPGAYHAAELPPPFIALGDVGLPVLLLLVAVLPASRTSGDSHEVVDFINSLLVFLLLATLVLGSLANMVIFKATYARSLLQTLAVLGGVLLFLGWIWNPHLGFGGLESFFARYLTSLGMPAERWLQALTNLALRESSPAEFLGAACHEMADRLPWIRGVEWEADGAKGTAGELEGVCTSFSHQAIRLGVITRYPLSPSLVWNVNLFVELLAEFHADKKRAERLRAMSYLQAVHETGARLTHDVKNLLQSLQTLVFAVDQAEADDSPELRGLLRRQLPAIAGRLATTLDKLRVPEAVADARELDFALWWDEIGRRYQHHGWLTVESPPSGLSGRVPAAAMFSIVDNLVANVEQKRAVETRVKCRVEARAATAGGGIAIEVVDSGTAIPSAVAAQLFLQPMRSDSGLGIGLYQSAQLARQCGYELTLGRNVDREVRFIVAPRARVMN